MNNLPDLPFEKILSHLSLEERIKLSAVSRVWYKMANNFKAKSLCYSERPSSSIEGNARLVGDAFAQNFISSPKFFAFFYTFSSSILTNLKHLRLCDVSLNENDRTAFVSSLNSFNQLEELGLFRLNYHAGSNMKSDLELNLPMLASIQFEYLYGIEKLTLNAPRLLKIKLVDCFSFLRLALVHPESVESLATDQLAHIPAEKLKNLKYFYGGYYLQIDSKLLSTLEQLKEIHLGDKDKVLKFFEAKHHYGRTDLKIYLFGLLLNGPEDSIIHLDLDYTEVTTIEHLAKNPSKLAEEIPFYNFIPYNAIELLATGLENNFLNRFPDLDSVYVSSPVANIERFLSFLKNLDHITELYFQSGQPQELFERLAEHCAVQELTVCKAPTDFGFLFRLNNLIKLKLNCYIDYKLIGGLFERLKFLSSFRFKDTDHYFKIKINHLKQCELSINTKKAEVSDVTAAIQLITEIATDRALKKLQKTNEILL